MLKPIVSAALVLSAIPAAWAQEDIPPAPPTDIAPAEAAPVRVPIRVVSSLTVDDLGMLLDDMQANYVAAGRNATGAPFVFGELPDGMTFGAYTICTQPDGTDCRGLEFMAVLGTTASAEAVALINRDFPAISVYKADEDTVHLSRYMILDYGITWANLVENARVFHVLCGKVQARLSELPPEQSEVVTR